MPVIGIKPSWFGVRCHAGSNPVYSTWSNLVVVKTTLVGMRKIMQKTTTQAIIPRGWGWHFKTLGHQLIGKATNLIRLQSRIVPGCPNLKWYRFEPYMPVLKSIWLMVNSSRILIWKCKVWHWCNWLTYFTNGMSSNRLGDVTDNHAIPVQV